MAQPCVLHNLVSRKLHAAVPFENVVAGLVLSIKPTPQGLLHDVQLPKFDASHAILKHLGVSGQSLDSDKFGHV
jgi:hypothetical protein